MIVRSRSWTVCGARWQRQARSLARQWQRGLSWAEFICTASARQGSLSSAGGWSASSHLPPWYANLGRTRVAAPAAVCFRCSTPAGRVAVECYELLNCPRLSSTRTLTTHLPRHLDGRPGPRNRLNICNNPLNIVSPCVATIGTGFSDHDFDAPAASLHPACTLRPQSLRFLVQAGLP